MNGSPALKIVVVHLKNNVLQWVDENEHVSDPVENAVVLTTEGVRMDEVSQAAALDAGSISIHEGLQDDVRPDDSISNVQSRRSTQGSGSGKRSSVSGTSFARIKAEADLAALMSRQKLLQDKHALEEEQQQLRKQKERLLLVEGIAAHVAKVSVLRAGSKHTGKPHSNAMNSYFKNEQEKTKFNINAAPSIAQRLETPKQLETLSAIR